MSPSPEVVCVPAPEPMMIALRTFSGATKMPVAASAPSDPEPSNWTVIFDCETRTDAAQQLRFGVYQVRNSRKLVEHGVFFDPNGIGTDEFKLLRSWTNARNLSLISRTQFINEIFLRYGYDLQGAITGFNLPFDLSRIAIGHGSARGDMRGGFSLKLSSSSRRPRVQVKHLSARSARIRFTHPGKQLTPRGMRKRGIPVRPHRGFFVDLKTLASALTSGSYNLRSLGEFLGVNTRKLDTEEHGGSLTSEYLEYALNDVQTTWECYCELIRRYRSHLLERTPAHRIMSEASLGKGYLREMGIRPWRQMQRDFPAKIIGQIMSAYYGGRSEIHIRRMPTRVLYCDFLSMYPTVCTLMELWKFVIADRMDWRDCTEETRAYLARIGISDLQKPSSWRELTTLVRICPDADILPVRAPYGEAQKTIGLNYFSSDNSLWFTLADCIASKLLTGKAPRVIEAITFRAGKPQAGLQSICIGGNPQYRVEPARVDFYRKAIDRRNEVKAHLKQAKRRSQLQSVRQLEAEQLALKILANSTSYGIFVEINVEELDTRAPVTCYAVDGTAFSVQTDKLEKPGTYFHPLLASLITGAARLMLAITERLAVDRALDWAFCDTDSMALAKPVPMGEDEFLEKVEDVRRWFDPLNPYQMMDPLLKLEDANFGPTGELTPLYCFAVSAKRYALFNLDSSGRPVIRKASAHGLGHLRAPYINDQAPTHIPAPTVALSEIGVDRWQHDLWYQIVSAALEGRPDRPDLDFHPALIQPAISRYGATTPELLGWFKAYNASRSYHEQVRPFGFLTGLQVARLAPSSASSEPGKRPRRRAVRPIAPFSNAPAEAAQRAFDRDTGEAVPPEQLATYRSALAQYHLHPESKFLDGDYTDRGHTRRRHVRVAGITYIGKEANRWEEQFYLGADRAADVNYGQAPPMGPEELAAVAEGIKEISQRRVARAACMSLRDVSAAVRDPGRLSPAHVHRLRQALASLRYQSECPEVPTRRFARRAVPPEATNADLGDHRSQGRRRRPSRVRPYRAGGFS